MHKAGAIAWDRIRLGLLLDRDVGLEGNRGGRLTYFSEQGCSVASVGKLMASFPQSAVKFTGQPVLTNFALGSLNALE
jgi:hypothetical protein